MDRFSSPLLALAVFCSTSVMQSRLVVAGIDGTGTFIRVDSTDRPTELHFDGWKSKSSYQDYIEGMAKPGVDISIGVYDFRFSEGVAPPRSAGAFDMDEMNRISFAWKPKFHYRWRGGPLVRISLKDHSLRVSEDHGNTWRWLVVNAATPKGLEQLQQATKQRHPEWLYCKSPRKAVELARRLGVTKLFLHSPLEGLEALRGMGSLTDLTLVNAKVIDLSTLRTLKRLRRLTLRGIDAERGTELRGLPNLEALHIEKMSNANLFLIAQMPRLHEVSVRGDKDEFLLPSFIETPEVRTLKIVTGVITGLDALTALPKLQRLECFSIVVQDGRIPKPLPSVTDVDLRNCILPDLAILAAFPNARSLHLSLFQDMRGVPIFTPSPWGRDMGRIADKGRARHTTLAPLARLSKLKTLQLESLPHLQDVAALPHLKSLRSLTFLGCDAMKDMSQLEGMPDLKKLEVLHCRSLEDLSSFEALTGLTDLRIVGCDRAAMPSLGPLEQLETLAIGNDSQTDTECLKGLRRIRNVDFSYSRSLQDLRGLKALATLQRVTLFSNKKLTDITHLAGLTNLRDLTLIACTGVTNLTPLAGLRDLRFLNLNNTKVTDLRPLAPLKRLKTLLLYDNREFADVSQLVPLSGLRKLDLSGCRSIRDLSPLRKLAQLEDLKVNGLNDIGDLSPLAALTSLKHLAYHSITPNVDCSFLGSLVNLETLEFSSNGRRLNPSLLLKLRNLTYLSLRVRDADVGYWELIRAGLPRCMVR